MDNDELTDLEVPLVLFLPYFIELRVSLRKEICVLYLIDGFWNKRRSNNEGADSGHFDLRKQLVDAPFGQEPTQRGSGLEPRPLVGGQQPPGIVEILLDGFDIV